MNSGVSNLSGLPSMLDVSNANPSRVFIELGSCADWDCNADYSRSTHRAGLAISANLETEILACPATQSQYSIRSCGSTEATLSQRC